MEYITKDTHLDFSTDGKTYKELYGMNGYPDMGSEPERKEVSNMRDSNKRYIAGLTDTGNLGFDFYYNKDETDADENLIRNSFREMKKQEEAGTLLSWRLVYPDGSSYSWQGKPTAYITAGGVGDPIAFKLFTTVESKLEYDDKATVSGGST